MLRRARTTLSHDILGHLTLRQPDHKWQRKFAEMIEGEREKLESQTFDPSYDPAKEVLRELNPSDLVYWNATKAALIQKDNDMDFSDGVNLTYEEIMAEKKLNTLRE